VGGLCKAKESEVGAFEELGHLFSALQARRFLTFKAGNFLGLSQVKKYKLSNVLAGSNLTYLADSIIFSLFYFIQECQDTP